MTLGVRRPAKRALDLDKLGLIDTPASLEALDVIYLEGFAAVVLIGLGVFAQVWVDRRQFYRRNEAGQERFDTYGAKVVAKGVEASAALLGKLSILAGAGLVIFILVQIFILKK